MGKTKIDLDSKMDMPLGDLIPKKTPKTTKTQKGKLIPKGNRTQAAPKLAKPLRGKAVKGPQVNRKSKFIASQVRNRYLRPFRPQNIARISNDRNRLYNKLNERLRTDRPTTNKLESGRFASNRFGNRRIGERFGRNNNNRNKNVNEMANNQDDILSWAGQQRLRMTHEAQRVTKKIQANKNQANKKREPKTFNDQPPIIIVQAPPQNNNNNNNFKNQNNRLPKRNLNRSLPIPQQRTRSSFKTFRNNNDNKFGNQRRGFRNNVNNRKFEDQVVIDRPLTLDERYQAAKQNIQIRELPNPQRGNQRGNQRGRQRGRRF